MNKKIHDSVNPEEVFLDDISRKKEEDLGISERKLKTPLPKWILKLFGALIFLIFITFLGQSFRMQVVNNENYRVLAQRNRAIIEPAEVLRGVMYDRNKEQLVYNKNTFDLVVDPDKLPEEKSVLIEDLSEILEIDREKLEGKLNNFEENGGVLVSDMEHEKAIMIMIREEELPGIEIDRSIEREYPSGSYFSHLIGYTGKVTPEEISRNPERYTIHDYTGKAGLERYYEEELSRERGAYKIETDASGELISREEISPITPGDNLKLWIDYDLQLKIKEVTERVLEDVGSSKASVVAMDPDTGGILAMVNFPSYDNNVFSRTGDKELLNKFLTDSEGVFLNRAIESGYPTGSTIKPLLAAAALEEGIISPDKQIHSPGYLDIPNPWNPTNPTRMLDYQAHGWTDMREAIAVSSNVYFYTIGGGYEGQEGLGVRRMKKYLELFGWGSKTGIDLPNETAGRIADPDWKIENVGLNWTLGDSYNMSIGQGYLSTTPIQVAVSYSSLVNGGRILRPSLVKEIHQNGGETKIIDPEVIREDFISSENLNVIKEGMRMTTTIGTARRLGQLPVESGAKTGTAQIPMEGHYHNWIGAFAPYDDPEIVLVVLVEEVEGITASAGLIAGDVLQWYFEDNNQQEENE